MMIMPSNQSNWWVHYWAGRRPGIMGHLYSPGGQRGPFPHLPYALDNGAFAGFHEGEWRALLNWACLSGVPPLWVAVPDVPGDGIGTNKRWAKYHREASRFGWPLAFVVQDGHCITDIPKEASVVFIGGGTEWKRNTIEYWCGNFPHVHVGRVGSGRMLRKCADAGAMSVDGTSWRSGKRNQQQVNELLRFLEDEHENATVGEAGIRRSTRPQGHIRPQSPMRQTSWPQIHGDADDRERKQG